MHNTRMMGREIVRVFVGKPEGRILLGRFKPG